jgi:hypothetical protein
MFIRTLLIAALCLAAVPGCSSKPKMAQLSGKVTFKGQPVQAGWISFTPDGVEKGEGQIKLLQIKDGKYDTVQETDPGLTPGRYFIRIAGFDGKKIPLYGQGKQIFNPVEETFEVPDGTTTKDFEIPESAGRNVRIEPTADT